ncbi:head-tail adaptor protein [Massilia violaceinigra]|uniref:Head-tail adaptor protein n=1 Tax=Massilia violaceinigra TaxID=2045208 RepID=A0ABY4A7K0_9BURK|nr:head-tail adaptor protein [Massilia violaceinigra]UOD30706.1 head-tail adaptor protein [Massilia violaceinigra]
MKPFTKNELVTIEQLVDETESVYGTGVRQWAPLLVRYWANVQDELPSRSESTENGLEGAVQRTRLRMQGAGAVTVKMRAILHSRGDRVMQIIAGPAQLDDQMHIEFRLEGYSNG